MTWKYSIHVRCACTGAEGKLLGQNCAQLWRRDGAWNTRHGSAGFAGRVETSGGRKMFRRFGYATKTEAEKGARHVGELLDLAETDADRWRIGDMITAVGRGAPLPTADGIRRRLGPLSVRPKPARSNRGRVARHVAGGQAQDQAREHLPGL